MYHTLTFVDDLMFDLETSSRQHLERVKVQKGTKVTAQVRPYVVETLAGPVEVADLFFADGSTTRTVPFAYLAFND